MKKKRFQVGENFYEIPDNEVSAFLTDNPKAVEVKYYDLNGSKYNIPISEVDVFENEMGLKKKVSKAASLFGGIAGTSVPLSEEDKIAQALKTVGTSKDQSPLPQEPKPEIDPNDPVKSIYAPVRNKLAELRQRPVAESVGQDPLLKKRQSGEVSAALMQKNKLDATPVFDNTNQAVGFIQERLDPSKLVSTKPIDMMQKPTLDDFTEESIVAAIPKGNETVELGVKKYLDNRKVKESIYSSNDLGEAAVKLAALKGDITAKQIEALGGNVPKSMQANLLIGLLNDENTRELAENDADLNSAIMEEVYNLPDKYPQAAARYLIQTLSQERENRGLNNAVLNFTSVGTNDEIVDDLVKSGKLPAQYKNMYDNPAVKYYVNSKLKTPGLLENIVGGLETGLTGYGKSTKEVGIFGGVDNADKELYNILDKEYQQIVLKPKGLLHDVTMNGGNIIGQIIPIAAGGNYLQAAKIVTNPAVANSISIGMQTYGEYREQARKELPGASDMKQTAYALLNTGIEMATENIVNDTKLVKQALSKYTPEINDVIEKFTAKEITREAAKSKVNDIFSEVLQTAKSFGKKTASITVGESKEEVAASILQNANNQIFGGEEKSLPQIADEAFDVWKTTLIGGLPLGAIGGYTQLRKNKPAAELIYEVAGNPEKYKPLIEEQAKLNEDYAKKAPEIIGNLEYAAKVRQSLEQIDDLNESQKTKFLIASLNEKRINDRISETPDKSLAEKEQKELKAIEIEKQSIIDPERGVQKEVEEFYDAELLPKGSMELLENEDGKFSPSKVGAYLKFIAQQANNLDENWQPNQTAAPKLQVPDQLIEIANERWAKEIESAQPQIDQQRELDLGTEPMPEPPSIAVQMPQEVSKPQTTEIKPAETVPQEQPKPAETKPAESIDEDMTAFVEVTRPELGFEELPTDILDNMDSKTMAVQGKRLEGLNKNLEKLKELFECIWS